MWGLSRTARDCHDLGGAGLRRRIPTNVRVQESVVSDAATAERLEGPSIAQLRALIELASDGIFVADTDGRYTFVNAAGCRLLGFSRDQIIGKTIFDFIPAEDAESLLDSKAQMLSGRTHIAEWRLKRKDGTWLPVEVSAKILPDGQWQGIVRDISERKAQQAQREALLRELENERYWLQTVLDALPMAVGLYRLGGSPFQNLRRKELLGVEVSSDTRTDKHAYRILFSDGSPIPESEWVSTRILGDQQTILGEEYIIERPDGSRTPVLCSAAPVRDIDGRVMGGVSVFQDMSERMRQEDLLREERRLLKSVFDILPVGVWIADRSGLLVRNNPAGERIWRGARHVPIAQFGEYKGWWLDSGKPIAAEEWAMARAITKGETSLGELIRIQCFDGTFKTIIHSAAPLLDENGAINGALVVNEDITALHEAQEKLRASEELFRAVFDLLPVGLWIADRQGHITLTNRAGERIWEGARYVGPSQFDEFKAWWVETGKPVAPEEWGIARAIRYGETSRGELLRIQCFDGSFKTVINWAAPIRSNAGDVTGAIAMNEDVTSLMHTQEQLRAAVRDREDILAIVSHDLRNPLTAIMMTAAAIKQEARASVEGESIRDMVTSIVDTTRRMAGLVDDLLEVAVAQGGRSMLKLALATVSTLFSRTAEAVRPLLADLQLRLEIEIADDLPVLHIDGDRIMRVLGNLLGNALKFTSPGGRILVAAEAVAGGVRFAVANSGEALPNEMLKTMFQPFWQAAQADRRGAGLGLAICRSIVEAHGGTIWAEPAQGERVRICFVLPRAPAVTT
jgi:PAS domain S-box-containing protein